MIKSKYRNIGICAHIDAGKTSLTERILFFSGKKKNIGEVYNGEADMDWMDQEKERGITITSAVTTVYWSGMFGKLGKHKINIIDTPGHIDFTAEVERSLRILDGVCLVLCAVGGIQPQTEVIWNQINKYKIPRIIFVNKLDRVGTNYFKICKQILKYFNIFPIVVHKPYFVKDTFVGIVDILLLKRFIYNSYGDYYIDDLYIPTEDDLNDKKQVIEKLVENDDEFFIKYLESGITYNEIILLIRRYTLLGTIVPVFCGSVLKNKGIQNFLDGIINFLPSPLDLNKNLNNNINKLINSNKFSGLIFKVVNDDFTGRMYYIRIYSGSIRRGEIIYNSSKKITEKICKIFEIHANKRTELENVSVGDIVAIVGLKKSYTGDTLCTKEYPIILESINFPDPVISVSIKPLSISDSDRFFSLVKQVSLEDPTIKLSFDSKTNYMIISGMGELHLEVFLEKIKRISGINFIKGKPSVSYRETISSPVLNIEGKYIKQSGGRGQYGHVVLNAFPIFKNYHIEIIDKIKGGIIPSEYIGVIKNSINEFCSLGFLVGGQIVSIKFEIIDGSFHEVDSSDVAFKMATLIALRNLFKNANIIVMEPIMKVYIYSKHCYLGSLTSMILSKRGEIINVSDINNNEIKVDSLIPLRELFNFSTVLRSITKGSSYFFMKFSCYKKSPKSILNNIIADNDN